MMQRSRCLCFVIRAFQNRMIGNTNQIIKLHARQRMFNSPALQLCINDDRNPVNKGNRTNLLRQNESLFLANSIISKRGASKKAKSKKKGSTNKSSSKINLSFGDDVYDLKRVKHEMDLSTQKFEDELNKKFSSDLTIGIIDNLYVTINGETTPLYEVAQVTAQDDEFRITSMVKGKNIEKQIIDSINVTGLNLNPKILDKTISVVKPVSSTDYKTNLLKLAKASGEKSKTMIRKIRQQSLSKIKRLKEVSKDDIKMLEQQVDLIHDASVKQIDQLIDRKKSELKL